MQHLPPIALTPASEEILAGFLADGEFVSPAECIEAALKCYQESTPLKALVDESIAAVNRGDIVEPNLDAILERVIARQQRGEKKQRNPIVTGE